jgi:hypothetical protein
VSNYSASCPAFRFIKFTDRFTYGKNYVVGRGGGGRCPGNTLIHLNRFITLDHYQAGFFTTPHNVKKPEMCITITMLLAFNCQL